MSSAMTIYKKKNFKIYDVGYGFIVHNTKLDFESHHTHINNFHTCKFIIDLCIHKTIPDKHISDYLLVSITRVTEDKIYKEKIQQILNKRKMSKGGYNGGRKIKQGNCSW